ncbi:alpha/beta hydrolase-fold protein [Chitinophaga arvensicola]|uniref:Putative esterase n=1 Tax=Chitinophaga arvensicola TaxID=29529 RepID=A0A1I0S972_9BACT|nr:alpha/beta hydrolase-fold protein [Chitinophaga arvensicola]SEW52732.1 Putative esterase [Chitinophaga arvensicola]
MKYFVITIVLLLKGMAVFSQKEIRECLFSHELKDSIHYNIFLPETAGTTEMPVLYAFKYGMVEGAYIAAQLNYFQAANYQLPNTMVVTIQADMDRIGFSYKTGMLTPAGRQMLACIKNEIIPAIEKKYHTSSFRTYLGHSYAASYASYLLQYAPELFRGYILLAPEKVGVDYSRPSPDVTSPAPFLQDEKAIRFFNDTTTFCYVATGQYDVERRKAYAQELLAHFRNLDSTRFISKYDSISGGNHTNILTMAIQPALEFIYQQYDPYYEEGPEMDAWKLYSQAQKRVKNVYGISTVRNFNWYTRFLQQAVAAKDTGILVNLLRELDTRQRKTYEMLRLAGFCFRAGWMQKAEQYYLQAINDINARHGNEPYDPFLLTDAYQRMAFDIYKEHPVVAWAYVQKSIALANTPNQFGVSNIEVYYDAGEFAVTSNYKIREGLQYLSTYLAGRGEVIDDIHRPYYLVYYQMAMGYYRLHNKKKAREYLQKVFALNNNYQPARKLMGQL